MIKFSINKNAFQNALRITKQAIGSKVTIPALTKLKIEVEENGITLIGSNGQISIKNFYLLIIKMQVCLFQERVQFY